MKTLSKDQSKKVYKAFLMLEEKSPDLSFIMREVILRSSEKVQTACVCFHKVEKKFLILISEKWLDSFDVYNLAAIIEHELFHIILSHVFQKFEDHKRANIAQDSVINSLGAFFQDRKKLNKELLGGVFLENIERELKAEKILGQYERLDLRIHDSKKIYDFLGLIQKNDLEGQGFNPFDEHNPPEGEALGSNTEALESSPEARAIIESILNDDKNGEALENIGKGSQDLKIFTEAIDKRKRIKNFKNNVLKFLSGNKSMKTKSSVRRPNRRFPGPIGKTKIKKFNVLLCFDVSGSMLEPETLEKMQIVLYTALDLGFSVDIKAGDTAKTCDEKNIKKDFDFSKIGGGGGTELSFFFHDEKGAEIKNENYSYIIITDGHFNFKEIPETKKNKILVLSTSVEQVGIFKTVMI